MTHETPPKRITINMTNHLTIILDGWYRRDLEKPNWHYYENITGKLYHWPQGTHDSSR